MATKIKSTGIDTLAGDISLADNAKIKHGSSNDLQIYHDGSHSYIKDDGTGNLYLGGSAAISFNSSDFGETYAIMNDDGAVVLYHNNVAKLSTDAQGINVTGGIDVADITATGNISLNSDNGTLYFGAGSDMRLYHDSNNSYIDDSGTGGLKIRASEFQVLKYGTAEQMLSATQDGAVTLYYDNAAKLATTNTGVNITGTIVGATATASGGTSTTALASTAFVQQELTTLIGGAPSTLNDLNELAAAINDDANYNSTLTTALATKLPLAGGEMSGTLNITQASTNDTIKLTRGTTSHNNMIKFRSAGADKWILGQRNDSTEHFRLYSYGTSTDVLSILTDGKVGIGYNNPQNNIHVLGNSSIPNVGLTLQTHDTANAIANINLLSRLADNVNKTVELRAYRGNLIILGDTGYGKVGIGTTTPDAQFEVRGDAYKARFTRSGSAGTNVEFYYGATQAGGIQVQSTGLGISGAARENDLFIKSDGKVGIGETSPLGKLHVKSSDSGATADASADELVVENNSNTGISILSGTSSTGSIYFGDSGTNWDGYIAYTHGSGATHRKFVIGTAAGGNSLSIDAIGHVGIAKQTPIAWGSGYKSLQIGARGYVGAHSGSDLYVGQNAYHNSGWKYEASVAASLTQHSGGQITHYVTPAGTAGNAITWNIGMHIKPTGEVGIGTTAPAVNLHINKGSSTFQPAAGVIKNYFALNTDYDSTGVQGIYFSNLDGNWVDGTSGADSQFGMLFGYQNATRGGLIYDHRGSEMMSLWSSYGPLTFMTPDAADGDGVPTDSNIKSRLTIDIGGNVGINGETDPQAPLDCGVTSQNQQVVLLRQNGNSRTGFSISNDWGVRAFGPADASSTGSLFGVGEMTSGTNYLGDLFTIRYDGRVGIGTTSPGYLLHAQNSTTTGQSVIATSGNGAFIMAIGSQNSPGVAQEAFIGTLSDSRFKIKVNNVVKGSWTDGGLAIGTHSSASAPLDVVCNNNVWAGEFTQSNTSNGDGVIVTVGSTASADYALSIRSDAGNTSGLAVKADGYVGIGTFIPNSPLHVYGRFNHNSAGGTTHPGSASSTEHNITTSILGGKLRFGLAVAFPNGTSNLAIRIYIDTTSLWLAGEVTIGSTYSNAAATGLNRYSFSHNQNTTNNYGNVLTQTEYFGQVASHFTFDSHGYDSTEGAHYFEFRHANSYGNTMYLQFEGMGSSPAHANLGTWYYKHITY